MPLLPFAFPWLDNTWPVVVTGRTFMVNVGLSGGGALAFTVSSPQAVAPLAPVYLQTGYPVAWGPQSFGSRPRGR